MPLQLSDDVLLSLANRFGTPLYIYHAERIREQYHRLTSAFQKTNARFFYACKALTNVNILRYLRSIGCNVDCSSINEVKLALHAGFEPVNVLYTSNNISFNEIEEAVALGVNINIDSLSNLARFASRYKGSYPVGIRLRPNIMAGGNIKISTGHDGSKFGIPLEQLHEVATLIQEHDLWVRGLHIHTGSDIKEADVFIKGVEVLFEVAGNFDRLEFLDLGGGFKVPYKPLEEATDMEQLGERLADCVRTYEQKSGKKLEFWFEPGKFLVSEAGYFLVQVNVMKETPAHRFAGVNSGFNHLIRPMFYDAYHTIRNLTNPNGPEMQFSIVGNICETDTFAKDRVMTEVREGDILVFYNAGAYGFEMSSNYNSRYKPAEVLVVNDEAHLIRRREEFQDLLKNQIEVL